ncbi:MAG: DUF4115 domain-containing protein [Pseudomonadota bacterium]|nr:DUF4115 domain-containing protein [Pseudomonadota bacterium]
MTEFEQESVSVGQKLRLERQRQGMSIEATASKLHLSVGQVEAIEADDYSSLPAMMFVRGFIRNYAKLLHLESEGLLACLPQVPVLDQSRISVPGERIFFRDNVPFPSTRRRDWHEKMLQVLLVVAFAIVLILIFFHVEVVRMLTHGAHPVPLGEKKESVGVLSHPGFQASAQSRPVAEVTSPGSQSLGSATDSNSHSAAQAASPNLQPTGIPVNTENGITPKSASKTSISQKTNPVSVSDGISVPPANNAARGQIVLVFNASSWVQVTDSSGKSLESGLNQPHTKLVLHGEPPYHVVIGNAPEVELVYNGKPVDLGPFTHSNIARLNLE